MSPSTPPLATYHFYPVARRGAVVALPDSSADPINGTVPLRATPDIALSVTATMLDGSPRDISGGPPRSALQMYGPGDVIGFDKRHIVRTEPTDGTMNFESNYFAAIEFDDPDIPWMFTPTQATATADGTARARLRPWIFLIVLADGEYKLTPALQTGGMATVTVKNEASLLPDLRESWLWAHAQLTGDPGGRTLDEVFASYPQRFVSRIICPRQLSDNLNYTAFLVPAFKAGCDAVLAPPPPAGAAPPTTTDIAWDTSNSAVQEVTLPVYFSFSFRTAPAGDFASLATRLHAQRLTEVGKRPLAVDDPRNEKFWVLPPVTSEGKILQLGGALTAPGNPPPDEWSNADKQLFRPALAKVLNLNVPVTENPADPDPVVVPPIYGRYHAAITSVAPNMEGWVHELNLDPRLRGAAGLGARVVVVERSQLMASAWRQVAGIQLANRILRHAQLARASLQQTFVKSFQSTAPMTLLKRTAQIHARIVSAGQTLASSVAASVVPWRALQPTIRRLTRSRGPLGQSQTKSKLTLDGFIHGLNSGVIEIAPPPGPPHGATVMPAAPSSGRPTRAAPTVAGATPRPAPAGGAEFLNQSLGELARPKFLLATPGNAPDTISVTVAKDSEHAAAFRSGLLGINTLMQTASPPPPARAPLNLDHIGGTVISNINPKTTIERRAISLINVSPGLQWKPKDPIEPIMAAPVFPQPMSAPLSDLSQEYLLPGVGKIPRDAVGLLKPNQKFIEAYMVGLNFEMARQLLWNGYPTDQRGSYFRQFWNVNGYIPGPSDPPLGSEALNEKLRDIPPIHTWDVRSALGYHPNPGNPDAAGALVLVIRGELLRRYPTTAIYATPAMLDPSGGKRFKGGPKLVPSDEPALEKHQLFRGTLAPDLTFVGFPLTEKDARSGGKGYGYFFVLQQHPTEPRFGLENGAPDQNTGPVTWAYFQKTQFATVKAQTMSLPNGTKLPALPVNWGGDSANVAKIIFRLPTRIAIYAELMLP